MSSKFVSQNTKSIDSVYFQHMEHGIIEKCYDSKHG